MVTKLHIGCGTDYREGYVNIDIDTDVKADYYCDMADMPFKDNTFDSIYSHHALEHGENLLSVVSEMARVSKGGAIWDITVPYCTWMQGVCNPHHHILFHETTFDFFGQKYKRGHNKDWALQTIDAHLTMSHKYKRMVDQWGEGYEEIIASLPNSIEQISYFIKVHK